VEHYSELWTTGKVMFVCINKVTAVRMHDLVKKHWSLKINEIEALLSGALQQESMEIKRKLEWMKNTEIAVIISQEQNEIAMFEKWGLDIRTHREKMENREMDKEFKDADNPFRIVFVCAMWLTGFDVKSLATIYLDKPLKAHTLMQTIARANRVYEGKSNGLVVDYIGVVKALRKALADYTGTKGDNTGQDPAPDKSELIARILNLINDISEYIKQQGFELSSLVDATDFEKLALVQAGANAMCVSEEVKKRFEIMARELLKLFKYVEINEVSEHDRARKNAVSAVYDQMQTKVKHSDNTELMKQINEIVSEYIFVIPLPGRISQNGKTSVDKSIRFDISKIDFELLRQEFACVKNKNLLMKDLKEAIDNRLEILMRRNPARINFYERYQKIIEEYNAEQDKAAIEKTFIELTALVNDLDDEEKRFVREGFENDEELAIYDLLLKDSLAPPEIKKVKKLAKILLENIKATINKLDHWTEKEETQAAVDVVIRDILYKELPESYDKEITQYRQKVYEFVYSAYSAA
jgi:type I restriction enzyme R subunit